ncbi:hypothetical protein SKPI104516_11800 [Skermania piniformis]
MAPDALVLTRTALWEMSDSRGRRSCTRLARSGDGHNWGSSRGGSGGDSFVIGGGAGAGT